MSIFRVLVIDDVSEVAELLAMVFPEYNFVSMNVPEEGVAKVISDRDISLVLLDYFMPGIDGISCLKKIKSKRPDIPVVMMSGQASMRDNAIKNGADGFLEKPFDVDHVQSTIENYVNNLV